MKITTEMLARQIARRCKDYTNELTTVFNHDLARTLNARGDWRFEQSAPLGGVTFTEYIVFSDDELDKALAYAEKHYAELI